MTCGLKMDAKEGWAWLSNSPKWHYFVDTRSLCRRWMYLGSDYEQGKDSSPDNCKECMKRKAKRAMKAEGPE